MVVAVVPVPAVALVVPAVDSRQVAEEVSGLPVAPAAAYPPAEAAAYDPPAAKVPVCLLAW